MAGRRILLVEDNPDHEALALRALRKSGVAEEIAVARDGAEALKYLLGTGDEAGGTLPQVVLLDLKLPKIDGLEVLRRLRDADRTRLVPVVVLSSSDEARDIQSAYDLGANSYVRKPVDFDAFVDAIRQMGSYWLRLNEGAVGR
jgi:two-component system, response regulator